MRKVQRIDKGPLPSIDGRPLEVERRITIGHWEDNCIVTKASLHRLKTINERVSGVIFIERVSDGTMAETNRVIKDRLGTLP